MSAVLRALPQVEYECDCSVVLPLHPRAARNVKPYGLEAELNGLHVLEPLRYLEFLSLLDTAGAVLTDLGRDLRRGRRCSAYRVTLGPETERPITLTDGTNRLFDGDLNDLADVVREAFGEERRASRPALWDGQAAGQIAEAILGQHATAPAEEQMESASALGPS